jgi:probable F420-dependent oxidoreductase
MKIDAVITSPELPDLPGLAHLAEEIGFDGLYVAEKRRDPFLQVLRAAESTSRLTVGTAVALALPRSPMHVAQTANDLQEFSRGRFVLGLGSQIRAHVERRFGAAFDPPVPRMREFVQALHAIWDCWLEGRKLDHRGRYHQQPACPASDGVAG